MAAIGTLPVLLGVGVHGSRPAASAVGKGGLYSCTTHSLVYQTDGSSWSTWATLGTSGAYVAGGTDVAIADGGTGQSTASAGFNALSPMTTSGDIIYGGASGAGTRLPKGSNGDVLTLAAGLPSWAAASGGALTVKDEGSNLDTAVTSIDFVGAGVVATNSTHAVTVTISGSGGGSGVGDKLYLASNFR